MYVISILCLCAILFMNFTRLNFRVAFNIFFPTVLLLMCIIDKENIRIGIKKLKFKFIKKYFICSSVIVLAVCVSTSFIISNKEVYKIKNEGNDVYEYILDNTNTLFVNEAEGSILLNYNSPIITPPSKPQNYISSGWLVGSPKFYTTLKNYNIYNLFEDMIDNDSIKLIIKRDKFDSYKEYFNAHYSQKCYLTVEHSFGETYVIAVNT